MVADSQELVEILKALSDPTRMKIVRVLGGHGHSLCVNALAGRLGITQSAVSQHLRILRRAGLVSGERNGYFVHYEVNKDRLRELRLMMDDMLG
jgi:ArsR family transcriptional regulator